MPGQYKNRNGSGSSPVSPLGDVANWANDIVFEWDPTSGSDGNPGYRTLGSGTPYANAVQSISRLNTIIPANGNGKKLVIFVKPKANNASIGSLILTGKRGYAGIVEIRASHTGVDDAAERRTCGMIDGDNFTIGRQWTVGAGTDAVTWTTTGTLPSADTLKGCRIRWDDNTTTVGLRGTCTFVQTHTGGAGGTIKAGFWTAGNTPVPGDIFYIEKPGAVFSSMYLDFGDNTSGNSGQDIPVVLAGLECTGATHGSAIIQGGYLVQSACWFGGTYFQNQWANVSQEQYYNWDDAITITGLGVKVTGDYQYFSIGTMVQRASLMLSTGSTIHGIKNVGRFRIGDLGCVWAQTPAMQNCGYGGSVGAESSDPDFLDWNILGRANGPGPFVPMTILSAGPDSISTGPAGINGCNVHLSGVDCTGMGANGLRLSGTACAIGMDLVTGSTGNTGPGVDFTRLRGCTIILGRANANSITGTSGDLKLPAISGGAFSGVFASHTDFTKVGFVDEFGNTWIGTAGLTSTVPPLAVTNNAGATLSPGHAVFLSAARTVQKSNATAAGTAKFDGVNLLTTANGALGLMAPPTGAPYLLYQNAVAAVSQLNLSAVTAGTVTDATPGIVVAVGRTIDGNGVLTAGRVALNNK